MVSSEGLPGPPNGELTSPLRETKEKMVPILSNNRKPLMPCSEKRARQLIERKQAFPFWNRGVFCIRLLKETGNERQQIVCGIDPGSKREAYTVATGKSIVLNILTNTPYWVKDAVKTKREMRRGRRFRKTPCRQPRGNNLRNEERLAPSTKARWQAKLRILDWLSKVIPITDVIVEDIKARMIKKAKKWNITFSPLQTGKEWFYQQIEDRNYNLHAVGGYDTKRQRDKRGIIKSSKKLEDSWNSHNADSHCLCEILLGKAINPFTRLLRLSFIQFKRRLLHKLQPSKGGVRRREGSTRSLGFKRGSLVNHLKHKICLIGGWAEKRGISLHSLRTGERITQYADIKDCKFRSYLGWRFITC